jgi:hypothetical protein
VDLHLEIGYGQANMFDEINDDEIVFENRARNEFFPSLSWMALLKNFIILKRGQWTKFCRDTCVDKLVEWVFSHYDMNCIERVWIMENHGILRDIIPSESQLKAILCHETRDDLSNFDGDGRFAKLEHIGGMITLQHWTGLPNLRYIHGFGHSAQVTYVSSCDRKVWD